jgi:hypothetical protein
MAGALLEKGPYENLISALPATRLFLALTAQPPRLIRSRWLVDYTRGRDLAF